MAKFGIFCLAICLIVSHCLSQTLDTYPVKNEDEDKIIVEVMDGDTETNIFCGVVDNGNVVTQWSINNMTVEFNSSTFVGLNPYSNLSVEHDPSTNANLTVSFAGATFPLMRQEITCHNTNNNESGVFLIGSPTAPKLTPTASICNITEGSDLTLDLQYILPFPPYNDPLMSTWLLNGTGIDDTRIVTGDYKIFIPSVWRELTGLEFNLTVSTSLGSDSHSFKLDVLYPPEAEIRYPNVAEYGEVGGETTLIAVNGLLGNPVPMYTWTGPGGIIVIDQNKYLFPISGRLQIENIENNDFGKYRFYASNEIGTPLTIDQDLLEAVRPGQPRNVTAVNIEDESATVQWMEPLVVGAPSLNGYSIKLMTGSNVIQTAAVSSSINLLELTGLIPAIEYNVTVTSTSPFQFASGEPISSDPITFTTDKGVPRVDPDETTIMITNSKIIVTYTLIHTGGVDAENVTIAVTCGQINSFTLPTKSKVTNEDTIPEVKGMYSNYCIEDCLDDSPSGELTLDGNLTAGDSYMCVVIAGNDIGDFFYNTSAVIAQTGMPSSPIISVKVNIGSITVTLQSLYPGVEPGDNSFFFYVTVFDDQSNVVYNMTYGLNDENITIDLPIGVYTVEVFSQNTYGMSDRVSSTANVIMTMDTSPTIEDGREFPLYAIVVIAVGGMILIFMIFMTIVMIALCINYKRKKDSVSFYQNDYKMTIRRF